MRNSDSNFLFYGYLILIFLEFHNLLALNKPTV